MIEIDKTTRLEHCGDKMICRDSRPYEKDRSHHIEMYVRRRRWYCQHCDHGTTTYEMTKEQIDYVLGKASKINAILAAFEEAQRAIAAVLD